MVEGNDSENNELQNKGVNVTSDSLPTDQQFSTSNPVVGKNLRNQVQNLINQMGPATPHFTQNSSSEADNEESVYETTSVFSSIYKAKTELRTKPVLDKTDTSSREISELSALPLDEQPPFMTEEQHCYKTCHKDLAYPQTYSLPNKSCCQCKMNYISFSTPQRFHISRKDKGKQSFLNRLLCRKTKSIEIPIELYKMEIAEQQDNHSPPRKLVFNLVEGVPQPETNTVGINTSKAYNPVQTRGTNPKATFMPKDAMQGTNSVPQYPPKDIGIQGAQSPYPSKEFIQRMEYTQTQTVPQRKFSESEEIQWRKQTVTKTTVPVDHDGTARVDVYYFDHGNSGYYETTDCIPYIMTEMIADKTESYTTKFWAEFFGTVHIGFSFCTSFILQFFRFLLYSIVRPLTVGLIQLASDYFFKPCLTVLFNAVIQPPLIFLYNIATSLRDLCDPIAEAFGYFLSEIAGLLRAIRLVEIRKGGSSKCTSRNDRSCHEKPCARKTCAEMGSEVSKCSARQI